MKRMIVIVAMLSVSAVSNANEVRKQIDPNPVPQPKEFTYQELCSSEFQIRVDIRENFRKLRIYMELFNKTSDVEEMNRILDKIEPVNAELLRLADLLKQTEQCH